MTRGLTAAIAVLLLVMAGVAVVAVPAAVAAAPSGSALDQWNETSTGLTAMVLPGNGTDWGQTFTAGKSGLLTAVDVGYVSSNPDSPIAGAMTVQIMRTTASGVPDGTVIASGNVAAGFGGSMTVDLSTPVAVISGDRYAVVLAGQGTGNIEPFIYSPANYAAGALFQGSHDGQWAADSNNRSLFFGTYVNQSANSAPTLSGAPASTIVSGRSYSYSYTVGGSPAPDVAVTSGALPPGLQLSGAGVLSGTPTTTGDYPFTVQANNGVGTAATVDSEITVNAPQVPGPPTNVVATPGDGQTVVTFTPPADDGGSPIDSYIAIASPGGIIGSGTRSPIIVNNLTNGTSYTFTVRAMNSVGEGPASAASSSVAPRTVPDAPTDLMAAPQDNAVRLSWTAPGSGGAPILGYQVQYSTDGGNWTDATAPTGTSTTVTGLTDGTRYSFRVAANNVVGAGDWSNSLDATPSTVPGAPTWASTVAGDGEVDLAWNAPADGGATISGYTVQQSIDEIDWTDAANTGSLTAAITGLDNGTEYFFRVIATNADGNGAPGVEASATPRTTADAPTIDIATPGDASVGLSWTAPASDGGSDVIGYDIRYSTDGSTWTDAPTSIGTSATIGSLNNGTEYSFEVRAENAAGLGEWSAIATSTPRTTPDSPGAPRATSSDGAVELAWTAPADGGATITGYEIQYRQTGVTTWTDGPLGASSPASITGLVDGTSYDFRVAAANAAGTGNWSGLATAVPFLFAVTFDTADGHSIANSTLSAGEHVVVSGGDLPPGATVSVALHSVPVKLGTTTVGSNGRFSLDLVVPAGTSIGSHQLVATVTDANGATASSSVAFTVAANTLAFTGAMVPWTPIGLALFVLFGVGAMLLVVRRRHA
jgi:hypothetical protein